MPSEKTYRAFLLGMSGSEAEKVIDEGILDGTIGEDDLLLIEEELIDDYVFGRLAPDEERSFDAKFLTSQDRRDKLNFSRLITKYAVEHARDAGVQRRWPLLQSPRVTSVGWRLLLVPALGCIVLAAVWFGVRDMSLRRELAKAVRASDERERLLASLQKEKSESSVASTAGKVSTEATDQRAPVKSAEHQPSVRLSPGVTRGAERVRILHLGGNATVAWVTLELPFEPKGGFREELLRADGERIWSQEFSASDVMVSHGTTTIALPAQLLSPGYYQIKFKEVSTGGTSEGGETYGFRVNKR